MSLGILKKYKSLVKNLDYSYKDGVYKNIFFKINRVSISIRRASPSSGIIVINDLFIAFSLNEIKVNEISLSGNNIEEIFNIFFNLSKDFNCEKDFYELGDILSSIKIYDLSLVYSGLFSTSVDTLDIDLLKGEPTCYASANKGFIILKSTLLKKVTNINKINFSNIKLNMLLADDCCSTNLDAFFEDLFSISLAIKTTAPFIESGNGLIDLNIVIINEGIAAVISKIVSSFMAIFIDDFLTKHHIILSCNTLNRFVSSLKNKDIVSIALENDGLVVYCNGNKEDIIDLSPILDKIFNIIYKK